MQKPISFDEFRNKKKKNKSIKSKKITEKQKEKIKEENNKILSMFNDEKNFDKGVNLFE